jgi:spore coat polysaccharide biosynthesis protein SpsF (cytidylyltransferase family)
MRTVAIIQARMASTRLPGKVLADLAGRTILEHVVTRVQQARTVDEVIVCTGEQSGNDPIRDLCYAHNWRCASGSEEDVLQRFRFAAFNAPADYYVRITADCPLCDPTEIDRVVRALQVGRYWYVSNCHPPWLPDGLDVEVMTADALALADRQATIPSDREHVTPWLRRNLPRCRWASLDHRPDLSKWRLCVDTQADLDVLRLAMADLGPDCDWRQVVTWLDQHPEVAAMSQGIERNSGSKEVANV